MQPILRQDITMLIHETTVREEMMRRAERPRLNVDRIRGTIARALIRLAGFVAPQSKHRSTTLSS